jgi:hypothetical protein
MIAGQECFISFHFLFNVNYLQHQEYQEICEEKATRRLHRKSPIEYEYKKVAGRGHLPYLATDQTFAKTVFNVLL